MKQVWGTGSGVKVRDLEGLGDVRPHSYVGKSICLHLLQYLCAGVFASVSAAGY